MVRLARGFTLLETLIALSLVSVSMTGLVLAMGSSSKYGALARRQATAMTVARSQAEALSHAPYADVRITNATTANDGDDKFFDPSGLFAGVTLPANAADAALGTVQVGSENYDVYVNVRPTAEQGTCLGAPAEQGKQLAVIVRYKIGNQWMRAVALGYRYNPCVVGVADGFPL